MDCSPPGSSIHGIFQARVLEWGAVAFSTPPHESSPNAIFLIPRPSLETNRDKHYLTISTSLKYGLQPIWYQHYLVPNIHSKLTKPSSAPAQILSTAVRLLYSCHMYSYNLAFWVENEGSPIYRQEFLLKSFDHWTWLHLASVSLSEVYPSQLASYLPSG